MIKSVEEYEDYNWLTPKVAYKNNNIIMDTKKWYASKTVWFNIIVGVVGVLALPEFVAVLPAVWLQYAVLVGAIGNFFLRMYFTDTKIV